MATSFLSDLVQYQRLFQIIIVLGVGGNFLIGFQVSVISYPSEYIKKFINATWVERYDSPLHQKTLSLLWSVVVSVYCVGGLLGCLWSGPLAMRYGKKRSFMIIDVIIIVAALLIGCSRMARSYEMILIGRFLYGITAGVSLNIHGQYIGEVSPKKLRGFANTTSSAFFALGKAFGQLMGLREFLGTQTFWPLLLALSGFAALVQLLLLPFFPESPPYLLIQKDDKEGCLQAMKDLWGEGHHQAEMDDMMKQKAAMKNSKILSIPEVLKDKSLRPSLCIVFLLTLSMQWCGLSAIYFYAFEVFRTAKLDDILIPYVALGVGTCEFISVIFCSSMIDHIGRRILLWGGYAMMALTLALLVITLSLQDQFSWMSYCSIALIFLFVICYGLGPCGGVISVMVEIFSQSARASAFVIVGTTSWMCLIVVGMGFPFVVELLGPYCFLIFFTMLIGTVIFIYIFLPETKGKSIADITEELGRIQFGKKFLLTALRMNFTRDPDLCTKL
ncbi:solute carrier family 2, facilitated glucose transporter member 11-like [Heteronotia binoei]|uniref:solute carrier family 2, facilitated glucose transporter member 11-like n=1 Tax=Heteronotia binoei TaxID=13085 RepID=UPI002930F3A3|nr:solute carrier family 2, facilitated glucose transporter member 11-like [Heteronotia binoei]